MKLGVVGGGITGCMAAVHSAREGHEVILCEASSSLGGVLLDIKTADGNYYNGCQYLQRGVIDRLGWQDGFTEFPHEYGSITSLGNTYPRVIDDCAQPALDGKVQLKNKSPINASALERLQAYGPHADELITWAQSFGDLARLDWRCLIPMQLSRLHFPEDGYVVRLKMENSRANDLLATPRRVRGISAESAWLPTQGYNKFFDRLHQSMLDLGINIRLNSPITPVLESQRLHINSRSERIETDAVVWATNPTPLFYHMYGVRLKTPPVKMQVLVGNIRKGSSIPIPLPYYWQVFNIDSSVVRIYVYKLGNTLRYSAEAFDKVEEAKARHDLQILMQLCGLDIDQELSGVIKQNRYVNFSSQELQAFENSESDLVKHGVIPGGWQYYGREEKVNSVITLLDQVLKNKGKSLHE